MEKYNLHLKPSWWHLKWQSLNKPGVSRDDCLQLIINLYTHYGYDIDLSTDVWTESKRSSRKEKCNNDFNSACASTAENVSKNSNVQYLVDYNSQI